MKSRRKSKPEDALDFDVWLSKFPPHAREAFYIRRIPENQQWLIRHVWEAAIKAALTYKDSND